MNKGVSLRAVVCAVLLASVLFATSGQAADEQVVKVVVGLPAGIGPLDRALASRLAEKLDALPQLEVVGLWTPEGGGTFIAYAGSAQVVIGAPTRPVQNRELQALQRGAQILGSTLVLAGFRIRRIGRTSVLETRAYLLDPEKGSGIQSVDQLALPDGKPFAKQATDVSGTSDPKDFLCVAKVEDLTAELVVTGEKSLAGQIVRLLGVLWSRPDLAQAQAQERAGEIYATPEPSPAAYELFGAALMAQATDKRVELLRKATQADARFPNPWLSLALSAQQEVERQQALNRFLQLWPDYHRRAEMEGQVRELK
jgi:hypothetical protein